MSNCNGGLYLLVLLFSGVRSSADIAAKTWDAIPNCDLIQLDSGHLPRLERPDEFIRIMNGFLRDQ